jgi:hypothetical protein
MDVLDLLAKEASRMLGGLLGEVFGKVAALLFFLLFLFVLWGLPWLQIISRSGFKGRARRWLFCLMFAPVVIAVGLDVLLANTNRTTSLSGIAGALSYLGLWLVALLPVKQKKSTSAALDG